MKSNIDKLRDRRVVPDNAVEQRHDDMDTVIYLYQCCCNRSPFAAICYDGRRLKPGFSYRFSNEIKRSQFINNWLDDKRKIIEEKLERRNFKTSLIAGSILYCSWGYDQTNVEFWQVVKKKSDKTVVIRQLAVKNLEPDKRMLGKIIPIPNVFHSAEQFEKRVTIGDRIKFESFRSLSPWDDKPKYCSSYA